MSPVHSRGETISLDQTNVKENVYPLFCLGSEKRIQN